MRRASRQYWADTWLSRRAAAQAHRGEHLPQPAVGPGRLARAALAAGEVVPGQRPAHDARCAAVGNTDMSTPRSATMHSGCPLAHPGDGVQPVPRLGEPGEHPVDMGVEFSDRGLQLLQVPKGQAHQQGVMVPEPAPQRLTQLGSLVRSRPLASSASTWGSRSPRTKRPARSSARNLSGGEGVRRSPVAWRRSAQVDANVDPTVRPRRAPSVRVERVAVADQWGWRACSR
jgi:hypothetical protein